MVNLGNNDLPALTALHAWERRPNSESNSLFVGFPAPPSRQLFLQPFELIWGNRISIATESISMPTKDMVVAGPSSFFGFNW